MPKPRSEANTHRVSNASSGLNRHRPCLYAVSKTENAPTAHPSVHALARIVSIAPKAPSRRLPGAYASFKQFEALKRVAQEYAHA